MKWTTEIPTSPGYYWLHREGRTLALVCLVLVWGCEEEDEPTEPRLHFFNYEQDFHLDKFPGALWLGPLEVPSVTLEPAP